MDDKIFQLILAIIPVLGTIITAYIIPLLKEKVGNEKLAQYEEWAMMAVRCAELMFSEQSMGEDKKAYVVNFLNKKFNSEKIVITESQLEVLIESAVKEMKEIENM